MTSRCKNDSVTVPNSIGRTTATHRHTQRDVEQALCHFTALLHQNLLDFQHQSNRTMVTAQEIYEVETVMDMFH